MRETYRNAGQNWRCHVNVGGTWPQHPMGTHSDRERGKIKFSQTSERTQKIRKKGKERQGKELRRSWGLVV